MNIRASVVLVVLALGLTGCQAVKKPLPLQAPQVPAMSAPQEKDSPLARILAEMPSAKWEMTSRHPPRSDYLVIPGDNSFYLFRDGVQFVDENSALRYLDREGGFELLTIEQRDGLYTHPVCPSDAFAFTCVENHSIIIATNILCSPTECDYDFVIFDYHRKFRFLKNPPAIKAIINFMLEEEEMKYYFPYRYNEEFEVKHRASGRIAAESRPWHDYLRERARLLRRVIGEAVASHDIRMIEDRASR